MQQLTITIRDQWRDWLRRNHGKSAGIWLVFYKKHTGKPTMTLTVLMQGKKLGLK